MLYNNVSSQVEKTRWMIFQAALDRFGVLCCDIIVLNSCLFSQLDHTDKIKFKYFSMMTLKAENKQAKELTSKFKN